MARFTHPAFFDGGIQNLAVPHGQFFSLTTQQAVTANVAQAVMFEHIIYSQGVTVEQDLNGHYTEITFQNAGVYNIAFSGQVHNTGGGGRGEHIWLWFRKNGVDIPNSNTTVTIPNGRYAVVAWNIFVAVEAGDNVQLVGYPDNTAIVLEYVPPIPGDGPAIPSMILTVNQVSQITE